MRLPSRLIVPESRIERAEQMQERALSRTGGADDAQELAGLHLQVQSVEHANLNGVPAVGLERFSAVSIAFPMRNSEFGLRNQNPRCFFIPHSEFRIPHYSSEARTGWSRARHAAGG